MKKIIWACIALLPFSVSAANKWLYGHGPNEHFSHYSDRFLAPTSDQEADYRDPASAPGSEKDYDAKHESDHPLDQVFDRSTDPNKSYSEDSTDWDATQDRPSDWDQ